MASQHPLEFQNNPHLFKEWVVRPQGRPLLQEADWVSANGVEAIASSSAGGKYGILIQGTGNGGAVARTKTKFFGGSGAAVCTSGDVANDLAEVKWTIPFWQTGIVSFEHKWNVSSNAKIDFGIESRTSEIIQARMRYDVSTDEWQYEDPATNDAYLSFSSPLVIRQPDILQAGDQWGWARLVVDLVRREYILFEAAGKDGVLERRDMRGIAMRNRGDGTGTNNLLFFGLVVSRSTSNQQLYTTDWCVARLGEPAYS